MVSAQACSLPVPQNGIAEFNPVLFNYQSSSGNLAVLTILVTVQLYKATSTGVVSPEDVADIAAQINMVYERADYVGSLVLDASYSQSPVLME